MLNSTSVPCPLTPPVDSHEQEQSNPTYETIKDLFDVATITSTGTLNLPDRNNHINSISPSMDPNPAYTTLPSASIADNHAARNTLVAAGFVMENNVSYASVTHKK